MLFGYIYFLNVKCLTVYPVLGHGIMRSVNALTAVFIPYVFYSLYMKQH